MLMSCDMNNKNNTEEHSVNLEVLDPVIEKISNKKIYFGHQSVGNNILSGIEGILSEEQARKIKILDSQNIDDYKHNMIAHSRIGYNADPMSKIIGFSNYMDNLRAWKPDMAAFKFCYVDFTLKTNVNKIFAGYINRMSKLKEKYPDTTFIHITVPLTTIQSGFKAELKKILGKPVGGTEANIVRHKYNELLRNKYGSEEPIFDLAQIESTLPDGARSKFQVGGSTYYSLAEVYSSDGRHLNSMGSKIVALKFLEFLSAIADK